METIIVSIALGLALSACCGFRVFVPLLTASLAAKFLNVPISPGFEWLATWPAIICFGTASALEILAYYFPVVDNLLDTVTTPSAIIAGTVVSASMFVEFSPAPRWVLALIAGGGTAGLIQASTGILRLGSTKFTAGFGNHILATAENIFSIVGSILAFIIPIIMAVVVVLGLMIAVPVSIHYMLRRRRLD